jgi:uncharacterized protein (TIGR03437 family)
MRLRCAILTVAIACSALAQTYTVRTLVGGALPENLPGLTASLGAINGMAADTAGNVYLTLGDYDIVIRYDTSTGNLTRIAGNGTPGFSGDGGAATDSQLSNPTGVAVDGNSNIYIADAGNNRIRLVSNGVITTIAGTGDEGYAGDNGPALRARFDGLGALALDPSGNLYITDFYNQVIRRIANGTITTVAGNGTYGYSGDNGSATNAQLAGPSGITIDYLGNLYIAEGYNHRVRKVSSSVITTIAGNGTAGLSGDFGPANQASLREPTDVVLDSLSNLYIADYGNNRIRMVAFNRSIISTFAGTGGTSYDGEKVTATTASLASPQRLAADAAGNLYIADGSRIRKVTRNIITTVVGGGPPAPGQLTAPQSVALDAAGNVFIADLGDGRIIKSDSSGNLARVASFTAPAGIAVNTAGDIFVTDTQRLTLSKISNGTTSVIAGGGTVLGDNGPPMKAQLKYPVSVAADNAGVLYVADLNRIRKIAGNLITTVAGNGTAGYQGDGGVATAAEVSNPTSVAVDSAGNFYFADYGNNRVRMVAPNGNITTVAGNGTYGFSGSAGGTATSAQLGSPSGVAVDAAGNLYIADAYRVLQVSKGKIYTLAGLQNPQGLAVDSANNIYVAEPATHRIKILSPGDSCSVTSTPIAPAVPTSGAPVSISITTGPACSWTIESLPSWITVAGDPFGVGPTNATLVVASNSGAPRTATILVGGKGIVVAQTGSITIAGTVTLSTGGKPLPGATITLAGDKSATLTTDSGGNFAFSGFSSSGTYRITPTLPGYAFVPASQTFTNATTNPTANFTAWPQPIIGGVGPVFASAIVPGPVGFAARETISIYGANLCVDVPAAIPTLPDRLGNCFVQVDGVNLRVYFASATQINALLPQTLSLGNHLLVVQRYTDNTYKTVGAQSAAFTLPINRVAMSFAPVAQYSDGTFVSAARPVHPGDTIILYATGLGRITQTFSEGAAPKTAALAAESIQVDAGQILYAGVSPEFPGIDQINLKLPNYTLASGQNSITIQFTAPTANQTVTYTLPAN